MGANAAALTTAEGDMEVNMADLNNIDYINKSSHVQCDFLLKGFDTRIGAHR